MHGINGMHGNTPHNGAGSGEASSAHLPAMREMAAYAAQVKRLTNYQVWNNLESALLAAGRGQEPDAPQWWNIRILLDELKWRLSGLEGTGTGANRIPETILPN